MGDVSVLFIQRAEGGGYGVALSKQRGERWGRLK